MARRKAVGPQLRISKSLRQSYPILVDLESAAAASPESKERALADARVIKALTEIAHNLAKGHDRLPVPPVQQLKKFRPQLLFLFRAGVGDEERKKLLLAPNTKGGALLTSLLALGLPILADLLSSIMSTRFVLHLISGPRRPAVEIPTPDEAPGRIILTGPDGAPTKPVPTP